MAEKAGIFAQVRTLGWPQPAGSPDRAVARLSLVPFQDLDVPWRFHLEVVADPRLAVIPPMGNALLPEGRLLVNSPSPPRPARSGPMVHSADLSALTDRLGGPMGAALAAGAWAVLGAMEPGMPFELRFAEQALAARDKASLQLARASFEAVKQACSTGRPGAASHPRGIA
ncbi:MAG: hypothetical protein HYY66_04330 [Candidatus Tectomicrobia bacterium]|nr:hypothetical protein [Candidatus Tectomicrobia bacterium]